MNDFEILRDLPELLPFPLKRVALLLSTCKAIGPATQLTIHRFGVDIVAIQRVDEDVSSLTKSSSSFSTFSINSTRRGGSFVSADSSSDGNGKADIEFASLPSSSKPNAILSLRFLSTFLHVSSHDRTRTFTSPSV
eukprot:CAMPEP_0184483986 /NCGR_PEP_ID=MMETSP0113_2-20130426/5687_1 /TAXON_ID=91329 /ORGANISM="Norrisiella sphaerica, Strain BC52" /LENGTH=135 /DNA_ID=CAMNT_0026864717 /DNA_START=802 /DNA_END=1209 /DNA_ORIENTATION=+